MSMRQLGDILDACAAQGLSGCSQIADAIVQRYRDNGGRMSRRDAARAIHALATVGECHTKLTDILLSEVAGWQIQDPAGVDMKVRPAVTVLWALTALDLLKRASPLVDWLLEFLHRQLPLRDVLQVRKNACRLLEALCAVSVLLPSLAAHHLKALASRPSHIAASVSSASTTEMASYLEKPLELRYLADSQDAKPPPLLPHASAPHEVDVAELMSNDEHSPNAPSLVYKETEGCEDDEGFAEEFSQDLSNLESRSALDELGLLWRVDQRHRAAVSKVTLLLGEVFGSLNLARTLAQAPHPGGL
eukprot:908046-Amphidinium_carterae.1